MHRRYVVTLLVSLLLLLTVACGGEEDEWTLGDSENWKTTCEDVKYNNFGPNCEEDEETIIKALADGWSKDCAVQYYTDVWDSETEDPDPYMCERGDFSAVSHAESAASTTVYELERTHYQEAQIEVVWADFACEDVPLGQGGEWMGLIWNIRNADGTLIGTARYKERDTGGSGHPASCVYRYSANDLPQLTAYQIDVLDRSADNNVVLFTFTAKRFDEGRQRFIVNYPDQGITTIAWRCIGVC